MQQKLILLFKIKICLYFSLIFSCTPKTFFLKINLKQAIGIHKRNSDCKGLTTKSERDYRQNKTQSVVWCYMSWNVQKDLGGMWTWRTRYWDTQRNVMGMTWRVKFQQMEGRICCVALPIKPSQDLPSSLGKMICFMENNILLSILLHKFLHETERSDHKVPRKKSTCITWSFHTALERVFFSCWSSKCLPDILLALWHTSSLRRFNSL